MLDRVPHIRLMAFSISKTLESRKRHSSFGRPNAAVHVLAVQLWLGSNSGLQISGVQVALPEGSREFA